LSDNKTLAKTEVQQEADRLAEWHAKREAEEAMIEPDVLYRGDLSDTTKVVYTEDYQLIRQTERTKNKKKITDKRIIYNGYMKPTSILDVDGNRLFEIDFHEQFIGNMSEMMNFMKTNGGVLCNNGLSDCVNAIVSNVNLPSKKGHATCGVYNDDNKLTLCLNPYCISDEQKRLDRQVSKAKTEELTKEKLQQYIDIIPKWHPYEILPCMSFSIMAVFGYVLKEQNILVPYLFNSSSESGIGKSLVPKIFSRHLFGILNESMNSVCSDYRLADALDSICGLKTIDEAQKYNWNGRMGEKIKQSAESPLQDKRGSSNRTNQIYFSRLVGYFTGNGFPIKGKSELVRFLRVEFDGKRWIDVTKEEKQKQSSELNSSIQKLSPIGYRLVEYELNDLDYDINELINRIRRNSNDIVKVYNGEFQDVRRSTNWGIVYEGLKAWERICKEYGINWICPTIDEFCNDIIGEIEPVTFESKEMPVDDFLDWLESFIVGSVGDREEDNTWMYHTIEYNGEKYNGIVITSSVLKRYEKATKYCEIKNMGDLARSVSRYKGIPVSEIYDPRRFKLGGRTKKGVFIKDITHSLQNSGNSVTSNDTTEEKDGYHKAVFDTDKGNQQQQEKKDESYRVTAEFERDSTLNAKINNSDEKQLSTDQRNRHIKIENYIKEVGGRANEISFNAFLKSELNVADPEKYLDILIEKGIVTRYSGDSPGIGFTGAGK